MFDMFKMMGKIGEAQSKMKEIKEKLRGIILEESELDGVVKVKISAAKEIKSITTSVEFYSMYSKEERESILVEVINNAMLKAEARAKEEMKSAMEGIIPNVPGLDIGSLLGSL